MSMQCGPVSKIGGVVLLGAGFVGGVVATRSFDAAPETTSVVSPITGQGAEIRNVAFQPEMDPDAMMAMMKEWAEPTDHHKILEHMAGTFDCEMEFTMGGVEPVKARGVTQAQTVMGGRFVTQHFQVPEFMGMPFEGMGAVGYDKAKGKFVNVWIDNFGTGMMMMEGEYDKETDTITWTGDATYPAGPAEVAVVPIKHVVKGVKSDKTVMEFWEPNPMTGEMMHNGTITYHRR